MHMKARFLSIVGLFLVVGGAAFAQSKATLTIIVSEGPAQIILNKRLAGMANPRLTIQVAPGSYDLAVRKSGLPEFRQTIVVPASGLTVRAQLGAAAKPEPKPAPKPETMTFTLRVTSNVPGAMVSVNGSSIGPAPAKAAVEKGNYNIQVTADGYEPYSSSVSVSEDTNHNATLRQRTYRLVVNSNVPGAEVFLNGTRVGTSPVSADLAPGSYNILVRAPGYQDYNSGITMRSGSENVYANLMPLFATVSVNLPASILNRSDRSAASRIDIYVDGSLQGATQFQVAPGRHTIGVASGGMYAEVTLDVQGGRSYSIEPSFSLYVR